MRAGAAAEQSPRGTKESTWSGVAQGGRGPVIGGEGGEAGLGGQITHLLRSLDPAASHRKVLSNKMSWVGF